MNTRKNSVRVGVIGAGVMGGDHARLFGGSIRGANLAAVADPDASRAVAVAGAAPVFTDPAELISAPDIDALVIASPDSTHHDLVLACISAGKPVLCEKPLATDSAACLEIVEAEARSGRDLVHVGFMRRFDPMYRELKDTLMSGAIGTPRVVHNKHRNLYAPDWFTPSMAITNSYVHEIDVIRWLLDAEYTQGSVLMTPAGDGIPAGDPILVTMQTTGGAVSSTEVNMNAGYGYHVHCEIVGTQGTVEMALPAIIRTRTHGSEQSAFPENWIPRFSDAYRLQNQAWIDAILTGGKMIGGATAWDGFVATTIAEQLVSVANTGAVAMFDLPSR
ncbi:Gfo/Idh/MocA family protein [Qingshengfaniella alkalisoli]|uniref:Gfo/Idh/MocA family oxidoreductase n=1 Tax=Qingshengfaniella alkalisoli TaxID=2599296 RepID=A0A5B8IB53_9RHOB|nr:Gfo/Idh/MocA family oxidoreductase [Qingshengfaniella alkalisoli]QDY70616.1 gfo/Idh/MocA family oxidoreductase [Qingshengfaniella alkalisoli]